MQKQTLKSDKMSTYKYQTQAKRKLMFRLVYLGRSSDKLWRVGQHKYMQYDCHGRVQYANLSLVSSSLILTEITDTDLTEFVIHKEYIYDIHKSESAK